MAIKRSLWAAALMAAFVGAPPAFAQKSVNVGVLQPLSGGTGPYGQRVLKAIEATASLINANGGVLGRPIRIVSRDDENTPAVGIAKANQLVGEDLSVILEGWGSAVALATQPVFVKSGILDITLMSKNADITSGKVNPLPVKMNTTAEQDAPSIATYIAKNSKKLYYLLEDGPYGEQIMTSFNSELKKLGWTGEVKGVDRFPYAQTDFRVALTKIADSGADMFMVQNSNQGAGIVSLIKQYKQIKVPAKMVAASGVIVQNVIEAVGAADSEGIVSGDFYFSDAEPFASNPRNKQFIEKTKAMFDIVPDKYMALGAAALEVWAEAANKAGTLDKKAVADRIRGSTFSTILGDIAFLGNGQLDVKTYVFEIRGGKIVVQ